MSERNFVKPSQKNISRLKILMIIGYAVIIALAVAVVSILAVHKTDKVLTNKVSSMASSLTVQMKLNINSYISRMETIATLAFASEEAYTYDATATDNDEYESLNTEKIISDKLYSLCTHNLHCLDGCADICKQVADLFTALEIDYVTSVSHNCFGSKITLGNFRQNFA